VPSVFSAIVQRLRKAGQPALSLREGRTHRSLAFTELFAETAVEDSEAVRGDR
jgi:hypothetical protein